MSEAVVCEVLITREVYHGFTYVYLVSKCLSEKFPFGVVPEKDYTVCRADGTADVHIGVFGKRWPRSYFVPLLVPF